MVFVPTKDAVLDVCCDNVLLLLNCLFYILAS